MKTLICPVCFENSLELEPRGVVEIVLNRRHLEKGRLLFNLMREEQDPQFKKDLVDRLAEYFEWRSKLKHPTPIRSFDLFSTSFHCIHRCKIDLRYRFSVIDLLISTAEVRSILEMLAQEYDIDLTINWEEC
ncbi:MAG: hypothetical protein J6Y94_00540 [Bacteriovoracaceae bacterium]|nr:hypothetical protein [Bacteriovoracaceae bacterium]